MQTQALFLDGIKNEIIKKKKTLKLYLRPLQCPHSICRRYVGVNALIPHFEHEHMNISIVKTELDERKALIFSPKNIKSGSQQCIALLRIVMQKPQAVDFIKRL